MANVLRKAAKKSQMGRVGTAKGDETEDKEGPPQTSLDYDHAAVEGHQTVVFAKCCVIMRQGEVLTRNMEVLFEGLALPETVDLGWFGRYKVRKSAGKPTRFYRC